MKVFFFGVFLMCIAASVLADGGCEVSGKKIQADETITPAGECVKYTCHEDGSISGLTCPDVAAPPKCKRIPEDLSKPYPECCQKFEC